LFRALVAGTVPHPGRFRLASRAAAAARPFARLLPARLANLVAMAPRRLPSTPDAAQTHRAEGTRRMRVALLAGCVQRTLAPGINSAAIRVLTRHGCEVVVAPGADCCGAFTLHMGKESSAKAEARRTIAAWLRTMASGGLDGVVVTASGCGTTVKDYGRVFAHDPEIAANAASIGAMALDVTELLHRLGLRAPERPVPLAVAYHDACSLQHAQKVTLPPRALLERAGFDVREVPERHFCCGSAGAYNMLQPAIAKQLGERKAANIAGTGAAAIAAGNLGCMTQIAMYSRLPVVHTVELLDWATGGPLPEAVAGIRMPEPRPDEDRPPSGPVAAQGPAPDTGPAVW
jgi:glycolate oxidase iron-sulfur subunit